MVMAPKVFQELYERLSGLRGSAVPVVGAGLAATCGAPSSEELADDLAGAAGESRLPGEDLYDLADRLESTRGVQWVQRAVANAIVAAPIEPSPALLALTLVPGRIIATTNYDPAIERAAEKRSLRATSLTPADLQHVLKGPDEGELFVLHLHGLAERPESIVLSPGTYKSAYDSDQLRLTVKMLALGRTLIFLGHSLASTEAHLRADIRGMADLFGPGGHLLLHPEGEVITDPVDFYKSTGVEPMALPNRDGSWQFVVTAAQALGVPPLVRSAEPLALCAEPIEAAYEPMFAGPASEVATETSRSVWLYGKFVQHSVTTVSELSDRRLLLLGAPGTGKTQTLLHLGAEAPELPVYMHLGEAKTPWAGQGAREAFLAWMERSCALRPEVPRLNSETFGLNAYAFLLDGLDEVRPDDRSEIMRVIAAVATEFPQHRWIVGSRRVPQVEGGLDGFVGYELVPFQKWLHAYANQRAVTPAQLAAVIAGVSGMEDLIQIPQFAAAAVGMILRDEALPASPLELLLNFASRGLEEERSRLEADIGLVERWLDRLSFAMLAAEVDDVSADEASADPLRGAELRAEFTVDWLVTRTTVLDATGRIRPLTRTIRDARAARFLREHPAGVAILRRHGLISADTEVRIRPSWTYVIDLLLADDLAHWRAVLVGVDDIAVARATPSDAPQPDRDDAFRTIWAWYTDHRIHAPRHREGQLQDDLDALIGLGRAGIEPQTQAVLVDALENEDPSTRANAISVLSWIGPASLEPMLIRLLNDDDDVVRRRAAEAAGQMNAQGLAEAILTQSLTDPDNLARRTLAGMAIELADDSDVESFVLRLPRETRREIQLTLDRRLPRSRQLGFIAKQDGPDQDWIHHLIQYVDNDPWTDDDITTLALLWRADPYLSNDRQIEEVLWAAPETAIRACLTTTFRTRDFVEFSTLLDKIEPDTLTTIAEEAGGDAPELVREYREWAQLRSARIDTPRPDPRPDRPTLVSIVEHGDVEALLEYDQSSAVKDLPEDDRTAVRNLVEAEWQKQRQGAGLLSVIHVEGERSWNASWRTQHLLKLAENFQLSLTEEEWHHLADLGLANNNQWLAATYREDWLPALQQRAAAATNAGVESIVRSVPMAMPLVTAAAVAHRALRSEDSALRRAMAQRLAEEGHRAVLESESASHPSAEIDVALVQMGDEEAEHRCLDTFVARGCPKIERFHGEGDWIDSLRHSSSAPRILTVLQIMLRHGAPPYELSPLFRALDRCIGDQALASYDQLIADPDIPGAAFLWYQREDAIERIAQATTPRMTLSELLTAVDWSSR